MANIQMNYYNGSSYVVLHPEIDIPKEIVKKQAIEYHGTGSDSISLTLNYENPYFAIGARPGNGVSSFGQIYLTKSQMLNINFSSDGRIIFMGFQAVINGKTLTFQKIPTSTTTDYQYSLVIPNSGNVTGKIGSSSAETCIYAYNASASWYYYLIFF